MLAHKKTTSELSKLPRKLHYKEGRGSKVNTGEKFKGTIVPSLTYSILLLVILRPHLNYTGFYRRVASWNDLYRIGRSFILYPIALQRYGVTFISPIERSDIPLICGVSPTG